MFAATPSSVVVAVNQKVIKLIIGYRIGVQKKKKSDV